MHVIAKLQKHICAAKLTILVPVDVSLRAIVIPAAGLPHTHPSFPRAKVPAAVKQQYQKCINATGSAGITTLRVDKGQFPGSTPSTREILGGKLPQEVHPGMINSRTRRDIVDGRDTWIILTPAQSSPYRIQKNSGVNSTAGMIRICSIFAPPD
ncbi:hypothetical protein B0H13DRAFT_2319796 [Mycena leptocephala]|nr:hypothetical protein B0H13DRAFT_2319796 [Mycena leptocephala]